MSKKHQTTTNTAKPRTPTNVHCLPNQVAEVIPLPRDPSAESHRLYREIIHSPRRLFVVKGHGPGSGQRFFANGIAALVQQMNIQASREGRTSDFMHVEIFRALDIATTCNEKRTDPRLQRPGENDFKVVVWIFLGYDEAHSDFTFCHHEEACSGTPQNAFNLLLSSMMNSHSNDKLIVTMRSDTVQHTASLLGTLPFLVDPRAVLTLPLPRDEDIYRCFPTESGPLELVDKIGIEPLRSWRVVTVLKDAVRDVRERNGPVLWVYWYAAKELLAAELTKVGSSSTAEDVLRRASTAVSRLELRALQRAFGLEPVFPFTVILGSAENPSLSILYEPLPPTKAPKAVLLMKGNID